MNEDPTIPYAGAETQGAVRPETPAASAAWGSFTLLARVGHGGFGEVYRAWDPHLQREVALKLLLPGAIGGEAEYEAMLREARALASVRHPNIVHVYGIDRHDGRVGFWTDYVRGKTLSVLVGEQGTFGAREAALIGLDVARALSAVHRAGLLHRDIKAENVMREEGGRILLMDFGLSALEQRQTNIAGTPNYMAPELFEGGHSSVATDIYAMGVLLYFLVAGDYPVHLGGLTTREALDAIGHSKPLIDLRPDLPEPLLRTVSTAMERDPAKRFTSAGQLASALAESLGTHVPLEVSVSPPAKRAHRIWPYAVAVLAVAAAYLGWPGHLQRLMQRDKPTSQATSGAADDLFQKAQDQLLHSYKESNLTDAVNGFKTVLASDPGNALAHARLGAAYFVEHGYTKDPRLLDMARSEAKEAIRLDDGLAAPYITMARIEALQGQTQAATQDLQTALKLDSRSADAHGARGEVLEAQGRDQEALEEYQKAITFDGDDWRWPMSLGVAEYKQGKITEAIAEWQQGAKLAPDNAMAYYDMSLAHQHLGQLEDARKEMEQALHLDPTARKYAALGSLLLLEGKYDEAARMELKAIELNPKSYEAYEDLGAAYSWSGAHHDQALEAYRKAIALEEAARAERRQDTTLLAVLSDDYAAVGEAGKSLSLGRQAIALTPDDQFVQYKTGEALEILGRRSEAIPLLGKALASGYNTYEFEHNPELASLRGDPKFTAALNELKAKKK